MMPRIVGSRAASAAAVGLGVSMLLAVVAWPGGYEPELCQERRGVPGTGLRAASAGGDGGQRYVVGGSAQPSPSETEQERGSEGSRKPANAGEFDPAPSHASSAAFLGDLPHALRTQIVGPSLFDDGTPVPPAKYIKQRRKPQPASKGSEKQRSGNEPSRDLKSSRSNALRSQRSGIRRQAKLRLKRVSKQRVELRLHCQPQLRPQLLRQEGSHQLRVRIPKQCKSSAIRRARGSRGSIVWRSRAVGAQLWLEFKAKPGWAFVEAYPTSQGWLAAFERSRALPH